MPSGTLIQPFRDGVDNAGFLNAIRNQATTAFQERIPEATQANLMQLSEDIMSYQATRNEFVDALINQIGMIIARNITWSNPLAKFKRGMLTFGNTIEEVQVGLVDAYVYDPQRDYTEKDIFGQAAIETQSAWHKINRQNYYKITVNDAMLRRAFLEPGGLQSFVGQIMAAPTTSDQWDEFLLTCELFSLYEQNGGFFKVNVPDVIASTSTGDDAKGLLRSIRTYADNLTFVNREYNAARMPTFANRDDLELIMSPEANAAIDVEALAAAFNIDRASIPARTTIVPQSQFGIPNAQAILTTKDFFVIADTLIENRSMQNPTGLYNNYWFHHHEVISASPFVPAILFTTDPGTVITINSTPVTGISSFTAVDNTGTTVTELARGAYYQIGVEALPTGADQAVILRIEGALSGQTFIANTGTLYIAPNERGSQITVVAQSVSNPSITSEQTYTLTGEIAQYWPNPQMLPASDGVSVTETTTSTRTVTDGVTTASSTTVTSATAAFTASDDGATITGGSIPAGTTIASVTNSTTAVLSAAPTASATGVSFTITETVPYE